jgi:hypothetical protein
LSGDFGQPHTKSSTVAVRHPHERSLFIIVMSWMDKWEVGAAH